MTDALRAWIAVQEQLATNDAVNQASAEASVGGVLLLDWAYG
jgi:hypothetical protein